MSLATCTAQTQIVDVEGRPLEGVRFTVRVSSYLLSGNFIMPAEFDAFTDDDGIVRVKIVQGAAVSLKGDHPSFEDVRTGTWPSTDQSDLLSFGV